jgi:hypothetical protein
MKQKRKIRFGINYNTLINQSLEKLALLTEDEPTLNSRGITIARLTAFNNLINAFKNVPVNQTMRANITIDKEQRNKLMSELRAAIKEVWGIAKTTFGEKSVEYKAFNSTSISLLKPEKLYELSLQVISKAEFYFTQMQSKGLTVAMINAIKTLTQTMAEAAGTTYQTKVKRTAVTEERQTAANNLYVEMKAMCDTAIVYFENRNKLRASEYIIYKVAGKQQQLSGKIAAVATTHKSLKHIAPKYTFKLLVTSGSAIEFYFSKTKGGAAGEKKVLVPVNAKTATTCTTADLGFNSSKGFVHFCIKSTAVDGEVSVYKVMVKS